MDDTWNQLLLPYHTKTQMEQQDSFSCNSIPDSDVDYSFTSAATDRSLSARSSLARTSHTLSFNESPLSGAAAESTNVSSAFLRPHQRHHNPNWAAINAATTLSSDGQIRIRHLKLIRVVGSGNIGRVFLCRLRDNDHADFALKVVDRDNLSSKKLSQIQTEAKILSSLDHPFLPTLYAHLEVSHYTCLLMDFCPNGDLYSLLRKQPGNRFPLQAVRFFAAEVLLALEYLHSRGIVYRDLKPENVLVRDDGHIMLSDFDLCYETEEICPRLEFETKIAKPSTRMSFLSCCSGGERRHGERSTEFISEPTAAFSKSCVGTHEYVAPELVSGNGHGNGVDWWAFGILIFELLYGTTPFKGVTKESTLRNIASTNRITFPAADPELAVANNIIEKLLSRDPQQRLGCVKGATEIKRHPFFQGIKWPLIRTYGPPELRGLVVNGTKSKGKAAEIFSTRRQRPLMKRLIRRLIRVSKSTANPNTNHYSYACGV